ncbi:hypothetical protein BRADI_4g06373v3 [Brachypodium distachyon]|uniref:Uncharacterized protein n=1 Tax=Brachypodium distachyon TaxID=15368 RepID=A0A0Q3EFV1_BRADI|nr:hypothetical protein BRADI_4g06373v3 [Brachypodium distachyon]
MGTYSHSVRQTRTKNLGEQLRTITLLDNAYEWLLVNAYEINLFSSKPAFIKSMVVFQIKSPLFKRIT